MTLKYFTLKELEITCLMSKGASPERIQDLLAISKETFKSHLKAIYQKLEISDNKLIDPKLTTILHFIKNDYWLFRKSYLDTKRNREKIINSKILYDYFTTSSTSKKMYLEFMKGYKND